MNNREQYAKLNNLAGFKKGDKAIVRYKVPSQACGWADVWTLPMDVAIGQTVKVMDVDGGTHKSVGIFCEYTTSVGTASNWFPYFCLEKVETTLTTMIGGFEAKIDETNVVIGCQTFGHGELLSTVEQVLNRLEQPINTPRMMVKFDRCDDVIVEVALASSPHSHYRARVGELKKLIQLIKTVKNESK